MSEQHGQTGKPASSDFSSPRESDTLRTERGDSPENTTDNPKSWIAWKNRTLAAESSLHALREARDAALRERDELAKDAALVARMRERGYDPEVIANAYGFTINEDETLDGLTAGDMGYEPSGLPLDHWTREWIKKMEQAESERDVLKADRDSWRRVSEGLHSELENAVAERDAALSRAEEAEHHSDARADAAYQRGLEEAEQRASVRAEGEPRASSVCQWCGTPNPLAEAPPSPGWATACELDAMRKGWTRLGELFQSGGMTDPAFLVGMVKAEMELRRKAESKLATLTAEGRAEGLREALDAVTAEHLQEPQECEGDEAYDRAIRDARQAIGRLFRTQPQPRAEGR